MMHEILPTPQERQPHQIKSFVERQAEAKAMWQQMEKSLREAPFQEVVAESGLLETRLEQLSVELLQLEQKKQQDPNSVELLVDVLERKEQITWLMTMQVLVNKVMKERSMAESN